MSKATCNLLLHILYTPNFKCSNWIVFQTEKLHDRQITVNLYTRYEDKKDEYDDSAENLTKENARLVQAKEFAHKVLPSWVCVKMRNENSHLWLECHVQGLKT